MGDRSMGRKKVFKRRFEKMLVEMVYLREDIYWLDINDKLDYEDIVEIMEMLEGSVKRLNP